MNAFQGLKSLTKAVPGSYCPSCWREEVAPPVLQFLSRVALTAFVGDTLDQLGTHLCHIEVLSASLS